MISKPTPQRPNLDLLIQQVQKAFDSLSPQEQKEHRKQQKISFVYGNLSLSNPLITREMVEKIMNEE